MGSIDNENVTHLSGRTIQARDERRRRTEEGHAPLKVKASLFYVDDCMVDSTNPGWIQTAFDELTGLFNRVGLQTNDRKTVGMVCEPCLAAGVRSEKA